MQEPLDENGQVDFRALSRARRARANQLAEQIAICATRIDATTHHLLSLIREFDREKIWARQAAKSTAAWLSWRLGLGICAAHSPASPGGSSSPGVCVRSSDATETRPLRSKAEARTRRARPQQPRVL